MKLAVNQATLMKTPMNIFLEAISNAGFEGVELRRDETFNYLKTHTVEDLNQLLQKNKLNCITFNAIELFSLCSEKEFQKILIYTEKLMQIGNQINCDVIIAVPSFLDDLTIVESKIVSQTVERLKIIAKIADNYSFKLGFEPLGFLNCSVRKIDLALKIIESEELPEMGLVIDTFHYFLGEHSIDDLNKIKLDKLWLVHINDSIEKPLDQLNDGDRVLPSDGFFNLERFIKKLKEKDYNKWLSLELFNEKIWKEDPFQVAKKSMDSLKKFF
ncbi:MAG: sugar phosphate isomerase/epimerase family protein [Promethearchaeota archaeon]